MVNINLFSNDNVNIILKTAGNACNINCKYCFEQVKDVSKNTIKKEELKKVIENVSSQTCSVVFHGGEPLIIGTEKFAELLDVIRNYYPQKVNVVRIQTNGTLITEEWIDLLFSQYADLNIEIAISLDGTDKMNSLRVDYLEQPTFEKVINAYKLLEGVNKKAGMLSVISKESLHLVKEYHDLIASIPNVAFVKINALFNVENNSLTPDSITPIEYAQFVIEFSKYYIESGLYKKIAVEPILSILQNVNEKKSRYCNYSERKCFNYLSVYPDGSMGPCDCLSISEFDIGNLNYLNGISIEDKIVEFLGSDKSVVLKEIMKKCETCDIYEFCKCGCISQRYYFRENKELEMQFCESKHMLKAYFDNYKVSK